MFNKRKLIDGGAESKKNYSDSLEIRPYLTSVPYGLDIQSPMDFQVVNNQIVSRRFHFILKFFRDKAKTDIGYEFQSFLFRESFFANTDLLDEGGYVAAAGENFTVSILYESLGIVPSDLYNKIWYVELIPLCYAA